MNKPDFSPGFRSARAISGALNAPITAMAMEIAAVKAAEAVEGRLSFLVARAAREDDERCAGPDRNDNDAIEAKRRHQVAELRLAEHPAEHDQHDELRSQPEDARTRADEQNVDRLSVAIRSQVESRLPLEPGSELALEFSAPPRRFSRSLDRGKGSIRRLSLTIGANRGLTPRP